MRHLTIALAFCGCLTVLGCKPAEEPKILPTVTPEQKAEQDRQHQEAKKNSGMPAPATSTETKAP